MPLDSLSHRVLAVKPSSTMVLSAMAKQLQEAGKPIINLTVGEPDFSTPDFICKQVIAALSKGDYTKYTAVDGTAELKSAIIQKFRRDNQLIYAPKQIIVSTGAKQAIYNLMQALLNPGDEVIIPAPYWVSYPPMVSLASATPSIIKADIEQGFKITPQQLEQAITPNTRLLILNSPSNPTGAVYSPSEFCALGEVLLRHPQVFILSDEIYESICWAQDASSNFIQACPALYDRTIVVNGVSKAYAMTGWRIGYAAGPVELIKAMSTIQSQSTSCPNALAQFAAEVALNGDQQCVSEMKSMYQLRQQKMLTGLNQIAGIHCLPAQGAFYSFPSVAKLLQITGFQTSEMLAQYLLETAHLATVPGTEFGASEHLRLSFAIDLECIDTVIERLQKAIAKKI